MKTIMLVLLVAAVYSAPTYEDGDFVPENDIVPEETDIVPETSLAEWGKRTPKGKSARTGAHIGRRFHSCPPGRSCEFKVKLRIANSGGMLQGARNEHKKSSTKGNYVVRLTNIKTLAWLQWINSHMLGSGTCLASSTTLRKRERWITTTLGGIMARAITKR